MIFDQNLKTIMRISKVKLNKKGQVALFVAISVSVFLLYLGLYTINRNVQERKALTDAQNSAESFYLADTGIEKFLHTLKMQIADGSYISMAYIADNSFTDDGNMNNGIGISGDPNSNGYKVIVTGNVIKVVGSYRNINRAIELSYTP